MPNKIILLKPLPLQQKTINYFHKRRRGNLKIVDVRDRTIRNFNQTLYFAFNLKGFNKIFTEN